MYTGLPSLSAAAVWVRCLCSLFPIPTTQVGGRTFVLTGREGRMVGVKRESLPDSHIREEWMHRSVSVTNLHTGNQTKDQRAAGRRSPENNRRAGHSIEDRTRSHTEPRRRRSRLESLEENTGTTQQKPAAFRIEKGGGNQKLVLEVLRSTAAFNCYDSLSRFKSYNVSIISTRKSNNGFM